MNNRPLMFEPERILYEDNHLIVVNKRSGELVQPDPTGDPALEDEVKEMIRVRDGQARSRLSGHRTPDRPPGQRSGPVRQNEQGARAHERDGQKQTYPQNLLGYY